jgi:hypothetical protein
MIGAEAGSRSTMISTVTFEFSVRSSVGTSPEFDLIPSIFNVPISAPFVRVPRRIASHEGYVLRHHTAER